MTDPRQVRTVAMTDPRRVPEVGEMSSRRAAELYAKSGFTISPAPAGTNRLTLSVGRQPVFIREEARVSRLWRDDNIGLCAVENNLVFIDTGLVPVEIHDVLEAAPTPTSWAGDRSFLVYHLDDAERYQFEPSEMFPDHILVEPSFIENESGHYPVRWGEVRDIAELPDKIWDLWSIYEDDSERIPESESDCVEAAPAPTGFDPEDHHTNVGDEFPLDRDGSRTPPEPEVGSRRVQPELLPGSLRIDVLAVMNQEDFDDDERPEVGVMAEGRALFYRGMINSIAGEPSSGKSWTALVVCAQEMRAGRAVLYFDYESSPRSVLKRLANLGVRKGTIGDLFGYVTPDEPFSEDYWQKIRHEMDALVPSLVVIDSVGESIAMCGKSQNSDEDVARWFEDGPRRMASHESFPAVLMLDHMTKASDGAGKYAIGSQRKKAGIDVLYIQKVETPWCKGESGSAVLKCEKDRAGHYQRGSDIARLDVEPESSGLVRMTLVALSGEEDTPSTDDDSEELMSRVSTYLEQTEDEKQRSRSVIRSQFGVREQKVLDALDQLQRRGDVRENKKGQSRIYESVKPFRTDDICDLES